MDATASMKNALSTCKDKIKEVVDQVSTGEGYKTRVGLVAYR
jgi:hypothetical protein